MKRSLPSLFLLAFSLGTAACRETKTPTAMEAPAASPAAPAPAAVEAAAVAPSELSDALKAPRPKGGEYFGLYLMGKKVGYVFNDFALDPKDPTRAIARIELHFRANVGANVSERHALETRVYEAKPDGKLLSFVFEAKGDGGDQKLVGTANAEGFSVVRTRPHQKPETLTTPATRETIEDADAARVSLFRKANLSGFTLDGQDLQTYGLQTTLGKAETRTIGGVKETLHTVTTVSDKEKVPVVSRFTKEGASIDMRFSDVMEARAEPKNVATQLDKVEVFGLTRVVLPRRLSETNLRVPGEVQLVVKGLPERFRQNSARQSFEALPGDKVRVTLKAFAPKLRASLPLKDPEAGEPNLSSTLVVEAKHPDIVALAKKLVGGEKDAYVIATRLSDWVHDSLEKSYGASADRASDVLRQMKGDCTEHSLLTVALLRAAGVPARRVDGVVYLVNDDGVPALYWHEWVEAFVGEWTQLDPTFGQPVADASHFGVGQESNADITLLLGQLQVLEVGGR